MQLRFPQWLSAVVVFGSVALLACVNIIKQSCPVQPEIVIRGLPWICRGMDYNAMKNEIDTLQENRLTCGAGRT
jgi:hypothetical protein